MSNSFFTVHLSRSMLHNWTRTKLTTGKQIESSQTGVYLEIYKKRERHSAYTMVRRAWHVQCNRYSTQTIQFRRNSGKYWKHQETFVERKRQEAIACWGLRCRSPEENAKRVDVEAVPPLARGSNNMFEGRTLWH